MRGRLFFLFIFLFSLTSVSRSAEDEFTTFEVSTLYSKLEGVSIPTLDVFEKGLQGYQKLKKEGKLAKNKDVLSIIDFRLPSSKKRMWIIDMENLMVLHHTYVSHGRNSGIKFAKKFSNRSGSFQSSLGFYVTAEAYQGKHGLSLRLDGQEKGFNNNARRRAIVLHAAEYACENIVESTGRLGRSLGCPAIPLENHKKVIQQIKEGTAMFIFYPDQEYLKKSGYLNPMV